MKQIIQTNKAGALCIVDVPSPALKPGCVLVRNLASLASAGTEKKHMLEMAKKPLVGKALAPAELRPPGCSWRSDKGEYRKFLFPGIRLFL